MNHRDRNRDPRRGLPSMAERRKTNISSAAHSNIEHALVNQDKHRFAVGQTVSMSLGAANQGKSIAGEIVKLLPFEGSYYQYRVRSADEVFERIANEHDLIAVPSVTNQGWLQKAEGAKPRKIKSVRGASVFIREKDV